MTCAPNAGIFAGSFPSAHDPTWAEGAGMAEATTTDWGTTEHEARRLDFRMRNIPSPVSYPKLKTVTVVLGIPDE